LIELLFEGFLTGLVVLLGLISIMNLFSLVSESEKNGSTGQTAGDLIYIRMPLYEIEKFPFLNETPLFL
jgi:lipopolysaccharide export LptBFGC system permease protein LptF